MNVTIDDVMMQKVTTASPDETVGEARATMLKDNFHALPVVDEAGHPVAIVTSNDLLEDVADEMLLRDTVAHKVYTVPRYDGVHIAARLMRNHKIHHVVVTHEQKVVGVVSSFDLLQLVEDHRFKMKNPSTPAKRRPKKH